MYYYLEFPWIGPVYDLDMTDFIGNINYFHEALVEKHYIKQVKSSFFFFFLLLFFCWTCCCVLTDNSFQRRWDSNYPIYRKNPKISDTRKFAVITLKVEQDWFSLRVIHPKDAEGISNSVDPNQTPLGAVWSGTALFAQICLSENLGTLRYRCVFFYKSSSLFLKYIPQFLK